jgi:hypothetical protein
MNVRKSLAIAALALVALSGCGHGKSDISGGASASPSVHAMSPEEAKTALLAAALKTSGTTYTMKLTLDSGAAGGGTVDGAADGKAKRMRMAMNIQGQSMEARLIGTDMYIRGMPNTPDKWLHMDLSQIPGGADAFGTTEQSFALLNGVTDVTANPDGSFTGKADPKVALAKASGPQKTSLERLVKSSKGEPIQFTAMVKDGWLTEYASTLPVEQGGVTIETKMTMHLSDFGQPVTVEVPAKADILELSDILKG